MMRLLVSARDAGGRWRPPAPGAGIIDLRTRPRVRSALAARTHRRRRRRDALPASGDAGPTTGDCPPGSRRSSATRMRAVAAAAWITSGGSRAGAGRRGPRCVRWRPAASGTGADRRRGVPRCSPPRWRWMRFPPDARPRGQAAAQPARTRARRRVASLSMPCSGGSAGRLGRCARGRRCSAAACTGAGRGRLSQRGLPGRPRRCPRCLAGAPIGGVLSIPGRGRPGVGRVEFVDAK